MVSATMVGPPPRLRPFTFFGRVPKGTTNVDICKVLVQRFAQTDLKGVQDFGAGRFEITFKSKGAVDRFLADPALKIREVEIRFEYRGVRSKLVRVYGYPLDLPDEPLLAALEAFGKVQGISGDCVPGFSVIGTGNRRIRMEMVRPVPNLLRVGDRVVAQCEYEGVVRLCRRCCLEGHHAAACVTPKCARCEQFGHESCDAACVRCGGDHAVSACSIRTYSSVAARPEQQEPVREDAATSPPASAAAAEGERENQSSPSVGDATEEGGDSPRPLSLLSLSGATTCDGGGSGDVGGSATAGEGEAGPANPPDAGAAPAAVAAPTGQPRPLADATTDAPFHRVVSKKRKQRGKRSGSAARGATGRRASSDSEGGDSRGSEPGQPEPKRTAVAASDVESDVDDELAESRKHSPCEYCEGFGCDCSSLSDATYDSSDEGPPILVASS